MICNVFGGTLNVTQPTASRLKQQIQYDVTSVQYTDVGWLVCDQQVITHRQLLTGYTIISASGAKNW